MKAVDVISGKRRWSVETADVIDWLNELPVDSVDLLFTSPPYEAARTYGIDFKLRGQNWVDWMVQVVKAAAPKVKGLIAIVCEGQTKNYAYSCSPFLLMVDLHRAGFCLRKPPAYCRVGIPGSGGPDWLRNDYEPIVCITRPGQLPFSDNTACGHVPKWAPGGEMSHRVGDGSRVNQWGHPINSGGTVTRNGGQVRSRGKRPSHQLAVNHKQHTKSKSNGEMETQTYIPPTKANPGNLIKCKVGGGLMGHPLAHENEAPFPLKLADFFVRSFCPVDGIVADCFSGSGTTGHAAFESNRRFIGCDRRQSQVELTAKRIETVTPGMFA